MHIRSDGNHHSQGFIEGSGNPPNNYLYDLNSRRSNFDPKHNHNNHDNITQQVSKPSKPNKTPISKKIHRLRSCGTQSLSPAKWLWNYHKSMIPKLQIHLQSNRNQRQRRVGNHITKSHNFF